MSKTVRRQAIGVALFPFLAVLICTMGALIVLLVLLVQQARLDAREVAKNHERARATDPRAAERKKAIERVEDEVWRRGILEQQRAQQREELQNARLKVEHLEDHIRRLQDQARTLFARAKEIDAGLESKSPDLTAEQKELARLQAEIAKHKAELEKKKKELAAKDKSYALIPYDGPNGTKRRPIYIECTQRGVILQPEGVVLGPDDFSGPLNPGNPLDAALRAIRDAWKRSGEPGEPYPLLVVRPDGIVAYSAAREALRGWDDEFGYELVDGEKKLDFGGANPAMQQQLIQIVGVARQRQVMLAAAMPKKFQPQDEVRSFAPEDQPELVSAMNAAHGSGGVPNGNGELSGGRGSIVGGGYVAGSGAPGFGAPGFSPAQPGNLGFPGQTGGATGQYGTGAGNFAQANRAGQGGATGANSTGNTAASASGNTNASAQGGQSGGQPGGTHASGASTPGRTGSMNVAGQPSGAGQGTDPSGQPTVGANLGSPSGTNQNSTAKSQSKGSLRSGSNWGLPGSAGRTTAVTRPIRVICLPDRLIVVPERGDDRATTNIAISPDIQPAEADAFVAAVQKQVTAWGPALTNGYWKPVLQFEVTRAAEPQFESVQQLLRGSGFEIQRKPQ